MGDSDMSVLERRSLLALRAVAVGLAYWATARLGIDLALDGLFTPLWLPAGIAFVAVLRWGPSVLPGIALGEAVAASQGGAPLGVAIALGVGNALESLVAVSLVHRFGMGDSIRRVRDVGALALAIAIGAAISATTAAIAYVTMTDTSMAAALEQWPTFWASVVLAVMLIAPFVLGVLEVDPDRDRGRGRLLEALAATLTVAAVSAYVLDGNHPYATVLLFPVFTWCSLRFGVVGASGSILLATVASISYQFRDVALLAELGLDRTEALLAVQALLACVAVANLMLATMLIERDESRVTTRRSMRALAEAQAIAGLGSWEWIVRTDEIRTSAELRRLFDLGHDDDDDLGIDDLLAGVHPDDRDLLERAVSDAMDGRREFSIQHRVKRGTDERIVQHEGRMTGRGTSRRLVATALDVTQRTSIDRLRDALIATASHELRTPLTSIVGFADTLSEHWDQFDEQRRLEFVRIIRSQGQRLSTVVDDTLTQSRLDSGTLTVPDDPYPVINAIQDAVLLAQVDDVAVDCDTSLIAAGSQDHLTQILVNLLSNARKYGEPPFSIDVHAIDDGASIEVCVIDHGAGVEPNFRERIFERFTRGPDTDTQPGTGLGLSIVRGLAEANGGRVRYVRDEDRTIFSCIVPRWSRARSPH